MLQKCLYSFNVSEAHAHVSFGDNMAASPVPPPIDDTDDSEC